jgi:hypothetical protein
MPKPVTMMTKPTRNHPDELIVGLVSISDRASQGVYEDKGIPSLQTWLGETLATPWRAETRLIQDDAATISATPPGTLRCNIVGALAEGSLTPLWGAANLRLSATSTL